MQYCSPLPWFSDTELSLLRRSGFMPSTSCMVLVGGGDTRANFNAITIISEPQMTQGMQNSYRTVTSTLIAVWRKIHSKALFAINSTIRCILTLTFHRAGSRAFENFPFTLCYIRVREDLGRDVYRASFTALPQR